MTILSSCFVILYSREHNPGSVVEELPANQRHLLFTSLANTSLAKLKNYAIFLFIALFLTACSKNQIQREVTAYLYEPFSTPTEPEKFKEFSKNIKLRIGVSENAEIISYEFASSFLRVNEKDFWNSIAASVEIFVKDPVMGRLSINEEWYFSTHQVTPLLLYRRVYALDLQTPENSKMLYEDFATEILLERISTENR